MMSTNSLKRKPLTIFVQGASEFLTDKTPHGEGLICYSIISGLLKRGHYIYAYTMGTDLENIPSNLELKVDNTRALFNLAPLLIWQNCFNANKWFENLVNKKNIDVVWRMGPLGEHASPIPPNTQGRPLVIGPLYTTWPVNSKNWPEGIFAKLKRVLRISINFIAMKGWKRTLQKSDLILCATKNQVQYYKEGFKGKNILHFPPIASDRPFKYIDRHSFVQENRSFQLLFVGHLVEKKLPLKFVQLIENLVAQNYKIKGVMLGDGPLKNKIQDEISLKNLSKYIEVLGQVPNTKVNSYQSSSDLMVSFAISEPYGRALIEAMSVGTPCLSHQSGGPIEIISHNEDGFLCDSEEISPFSDIVVSLINDPEKWKQISKNALIKSKLWHEDVLIEKLENSLYSLMWVRPSNS